MKFDLKTTLFVFTLFAITLAWWIDRSSFQHQLVASDKRLESVAKGGLWWAMAEQARQFSIEVKQSPSDLPDFNKRNLIVKVHWLWRYEDEVDDWCDKLSRTSSATKLARELLDELNCTTSDEFMPLLREQFEGTFPELGDASAKDHLSLQEFVDRSLGR